MWPFKKKPKLYKTLPDDCICVKCGKHLLKTREVVSIYKNPTKIYEILDKLATNNLKCTQCDPHYKYHFDMEEAQVINV